MSDGTQGRAATVRGREDGVPRGPHPVPRPSRGPGGPASRPATFDKLDFAGYPSGAKSASSAGERSGARYGGGGGNVASRAAPPPRDPPTSGDEIHHRAALLSQKPPGTARGDTEGGDTSLAKARSAPIRASNISEPSLPDDEHEGPKRASRDDGDILFTPRDRDETQPGAVRMSPSTDPHRAELGHPTPHAVPSHTPQGSIPGEEDSAFFGNEVAYDEDGNPIVVGRAVSEPEEEEEDVVVAVAKKDSFLEHVRHNRRTRRGLAAVVLVLAGLSVGLGVALAPSPSPPPFWEQVLGDLDGEEARWLYGAAVSASRDGTRVAIGAPGMRDPDNGGGPRVGLVEVRELREDGWIALGGPILPITIDRTPDVVIREVRNRISVALSRDGGVVAVGSPFHDTAEMNDVGRVEVYRFDPGPGSWELVGLPITGEEAGAYAGASVSLSEDGGIVAVGAPGSDGVGGNLTDAGTVSVFQLNRNRWDDYGSKLRGESAGEMMGGSVSLSASGQIIAAGSSVTSADGSTIAARVFEFRGGDWERRGSSYDGGYGLFNTAYDVALSAKGDRALISNHYIGEDGPIVKSGGNNTDLYVRAFQYDEDAEEKWTPLGQNMHTNLPGDKSGYFISMSDDGSVIGMGDPGRRVEGGKQGHAHIYAFKKDIQDWEQVGPDIDGQHPGDMFGYHVSISGDGNKFVVGAPFSRGNGDESHGRVQVYKVPDNV